MWGSSRASDLPKMLTRIILFLACFMVASNAMEAEYFHKLDQALVSCSEKYQIDLDVAARMNGFLKKPTSDNEKCTVACVLASIGLINKAGDIVMEALMEASKNRYEDPTHVAKADELFVKCKGSTPKGLNDCEKAGRTYSCFMDETKKAGLPLPTVTL